VKVPQVGSVRIGDDVEIGANTTIDRGAIDDTVVGDGVKLDNQIQVGHNVTIGAHTAIAACTGISGSTTIGQRCMIGGMVGFAGHLTIADDVVVTGCSLVSASIKQRRQLLERHADGGDAGWRRMVAHLRRLAKRSDDGGTPQDGYRSDHAAAAASVSLLAGGSCARNASGKVRARLKNVTFNEPFFPGHFPHRPVMPGVMIIEALAQACGILAFKTVSVVPDRNALLFRRHRQCALPQAGRARRSAHAEGAR
jgi:hypothetical protein